MNKVTIFIQRLIRLCYDEVVLFVCSQIYNFVSNLWISCVCLIYYTVRCFNKAILIYSCITCKGVDQTDVRTFRGLDWTHTAIMCIVYISYLESGTIS